MGFTVLPGWRSAVVTLTRPSMLVVVVVGAADHRQDFAAVRPRDEHGAIAHVVAGEADELLLDGGLRQVVDAQVKRRVDLQPAVGEQLGAIAEAAQKLLQLCLHVHGEVGGAEGHVGRIEGEAGDEGMVALRLVDEALGEHAIQHNAPAQIDGFLHLAFRVEGIEAGGRLRQAGQHGRLAEGNAADVLVEKGAGRGLGAVGQVAVVDFVQIQLKDLFLALALRQYQREGDLLQLALYAALGAALGREEQVAHDLLRDGAAATPALHEADVLEEGAQRCRHVDARVAEEGVVLGGQGGVDQRLRDVLQRDVGAAPLAEGLVEHFAVAVVDKAALEVVPVIDLGHALAELFLDARAQQGAGQQDEERQAATDEAEGADDGEEATARQKTAAARASWGAWTRGRPGGGRGRADWRGRGEGALAAGTPAARSRALARRAG